MKPINNDKDYEQFIKSKEIDPKTGTIKREFNKTFRRPDLYKSKENTGFFRIPDAGNPAVLGRLVGRAVQIFLHNFGFDQKNADGKYVRVLEHINRGMQAPCLHANLGQDCPVCDALEKYSYLRSTPRESHLSDYAQVWRRLDTSGDDSNNYEYIFDMIRVRHAAEIVKSGLKPGHDEGYHFDHLRMTPRQHDQLIAHSKMIMDQFERMELLWDIKLGRLLAMSKIKPANGGRVDVIQYEPANSVKKSGSHEYEYKERQQNDNIPESWLEFPDRVTALKQGKNQSDEDYAIQLRQQVLDKLYFQNDVSDYKTWASQLEAYFAQIDKQMDKAKNSDDDDHDIPWEPKSSQKSTPKAPPAKPAAEESFDDSEYEDDYTI